MYGRAEITFAPPALRARPAPLAAEVAPLRAAALFARTCTIVWFKGPIVPYSINRQRENLAKLPERSDCGTNAQLRRMQL
jgi:hypothetical protein